MKIAGPGLSADFSGRRFASSVPRGSQYEIQVFHIDSITRPVEDGRENELRSPNAADRIPAVLATAGDAPVVGASVAA